MKSDWHPGLVSKEYKENFDMIEWKATIEGTCSCYRWGKIMDNRDIWEATVILGEGEEK